VAIGAGAAAETQSLGSTCPACADGRVQTASEPETPLQRSGEPRGGGERGGRPLGDCGGQRRGDVVIVNGGRGHTVEVNVAEEESKFGFLPEELWGLLNRLCQYKNLKIRGLMTVAPFTINQEDNRAVFRKLKEISIDTRWNTLDNISMDILSMGMTGDYSVAIEEGATMIRVGTGLFGARNLGEDGQ